MATYLQDIADRTVYDNLGRWCFSETNASLAVSEQKAKPQFECQAERNAVLITTKNIEGNTNVELISSDGRLIERQSYHISNGTTIELNTSYKGVAIIKIENETISLSKKVVLL